MLFDAPPTLPPGAVRVGTTFYHHSTSHAWPFRAWSTLVMTAVCHRGDTSAMAYVTRHHYSNRPCLSKQPCQFGCIINNNKSVFLLGVRGSGWHVLARVGVIPLKLECWRRPLALNLECQAKNPRASCVAVTGMSNRRV